MVKKLERTEIARQDMMVRFDEENASGPVQPTKAVGRANSAFVHIHS
jgi:hypothetical protein